MFKGCQGGGGEGQEGTPALEVKGKVWGKMRIVVKEGRRQVTGDGKRIARPLHNFCNTFFAIIKVYLEAMRK